MLRCVISSWPSARIAWGKSPACAAIAGCRLPRAREKFRHVLSSDRSIMLDRNSVATSPLADAEVIDRVRGGDTAAFELIMRRYNQRLFRVARSIVGDD